MIIEASPQIASSSIQEEVDSPSGADLIPDWLKPPSTTEDTT
jgi:hypothetical protein